MPGVEGFIIGRFQLERGDLIFFAPNMKRLAIAQLRVMESESTQLTLTGESPAFRLVDIAPRPP
jgi:hypothetical protein